ncbi:MAG TPA: ABC transporter permease [Cyclobacteriaceae bacterium]|nr:ABC transporter permease [Cyclobacteriaceae bacterium]
MIRNYILVALRNISRHSSYTIINVLGLGLGMACALLIFSLVSHHLSYDNFHPELDRIYRVVTDQHRDEISYTGSVPPALGKALRDELTFTEKVGRMAIFGDQLVSVTQNGEVRKFTEPDIAMAEPDFFDIFSIPLVNNTNPKTLFTDPNTAIITERLAKKYFGNDDPRGQVFKVANLMDFRVVGVMKDLPDNTDLRAEIYLSYDALKNFDEWLASEDAWGGISSSLRCYARLKPGANIEEVEEAMFGFAKKHRPNSKNVHHYRLQSLSDVHFNPRYGGVMEKRILVALSVIGFFLVITACVNFVNLATARAVSRSREVGVRKVMGGVRTQIFRQFMAETFVITLLSIVVAVCIASILIAPFNEWFRSRLSLELGDWKLMTFIPSMLLFVTFVAGFYPGIILSGFRVVEALKGRLSQKTSGGLNLRRALIVTQFSISQILVIVLIVVIYQVRYARTTDLGFDREAIVMIPVGSQDEKTNTLKAELERIPGVEAASLCFSAPSSMSRWNTSVKFGNSTENENFSATCKMGDPDYISLFDIELIAGRNLTQSDTLREYLVNEKFVESLGMTPEEVIGQSVTFNGSWRFPIVGVVADFHSSSLHEDIQPVFVATNIEMYNEYAVKMNPGTITETREAIEKAWTAMYPDLIYSSQFLDQQIADFYAAEENMMKLVELFSIVAIVVGCMGLFGLVSFMALQRTKEIGIRKVLGGSVAHILWIFGKEFSVLIVVAFLIAAPAGWWLMGLWLQDYQYHVPLNSWIFLTALGGTFVVAILTVGYRSMRAATTNPVTSLRSE